jgi:alginate O-acetyltransferase complex protein AlgI
VLFCSQAFGVFFLIVFSLYWATPWHRARVWLLLVASFYFYASWNRWLAVLVLCTAMMDYLAALGMDAVARPGLRRLFLALSLTMNLGVLCYFKYANFFLQSLQDALHLAGASTTFRLLQVIIPIGISFYTFEAINYTVDVYRRHIRAERDIASFLLFILFFPHLVAGPIVRARDFLPQIKRRKRFSWGRAHLGTSLFLLGLFKKLAVADRMALYADPVFAAPALYSSAAVWGATLAYSIQIFCDFSGYADMALGSAHLLGYKLVPNFDLPYLSRNISESWRRWHMSLSSWLRDYLFIPLGGSRHGEWRTRFNLVVTMVACGLWHGPSWLYAVYGAVQGTLLCVHRSFRAWCNVHPNITRTLETPVGTAARILLTFVCWTVTLIIFRAQSWHAVFEMMSGLVTARRGAGLPSQLTEFWSLVALVAVAHVAGAVGPTFRWIGRVPPPLVGFGYGLALSLTFVLAPTTGKQFVYFQF